MNKDLDERLIPKGEYRDAMNIEVASSEGSDVGSIQNVLGNTDRSALAHGVALLNISDLTNPKCVGSVCDYENNKIYWFVTSDTSDCIAEYDTTTKVVTPILVSKYGGAFVGALNFSVDYPITGINIITGDKKDGYTKNDVLLFWTDNKSEPKQINVTRFKEDYPTVDGSDNLSFNHNTLINNVAVKESDITVIKKYPLIAPTLTMSATKRTGNFIGTGNNPAFCSFNFSDSASNGAIKSTADALLSSITANNTGLDEGVYNSVVVDSSGSVEGTGLRVNVVVSSGSVITAIQVAGAYDGENYKSGEVLKLDNATIGGSNDVEITLESGDFLDEEAYYRYQPGTQLTFDFNPLPNFREGDEIIFSGSQDIDNNPKEFTIRVKVIELLNEAQQIIGEILSVSSDVPNQVSNITYEVILDEGDPLFELKFPRFAYRWKYKDGQYSCYSPFSEPAFLPGVFDYASTTGHNKSMVNTLRSLTIDGFQTQPLDVDEVDILYKESNSTLVYVVDTLKKNETSYEVEREIFDSVVEENQLLRHFDSVPKKTKAQEIVGNRIIYGNYVQNYTLNSNNYPIINVSSVTLPYNPSQSFIGNGSIKVFTLTTQYFPTLPDQFEDLTVFIDGQRTSENYTYIQPNVTFENAPLGEFGYLSNQENSIIKVVDDQLNKPKKSIKTLRTYQAGVAYLDEYGRTSPVFTNSSASHYLEQSKSQGVNSLKLSLDNSPPDWATHYKYYIKEGSSEYYNLILDRFYVAEDGNLWLSFPSSDRDKIQKGDFIILKKEHDSDNPITSGNKFKTLEIKSSAPEFIKLRKFSTATALVKTKNDGSNVPALGVSVFEFVGPDKNEHDSFASAFTSDSFIVIKLDGNVSKYYAVSTGGLTGHSEGTITNDANSIYKITLKDPLSETDAFLSDITGNSTEFTIDVYDSRVENTKEFEGRFFAKVARNEILDTHIIGTSSSERGYDVISSVVIQSNLPTPENTRPYGREFHGWTDIHTNIWHIDKSENHPTFSASDVTLYITGSSKIDNDPSQEPLMAVTEFDGAIKIDGTTLMQFEDANGNKGNIYRVSNVRKEKQKRVSQDTYTQGVTLGSNQFYRKEIKFDIRDIESDGTVFYTDKFEYDDTAAHPRIKKIYILKQTFDTSDILSSENPAIFETEPKEIADLDLYHEVSDNIGIIKIGMAVTGANISGTPTVTNVTPGRIHFSTNQSLTKDDVLTFTDSGTGLTITAIVQGTTSNAPKTKIISGGHFGSTTLDWFNCYSYGNGVESNRIRDDFNAPQIDKGPKVSSVLDSPYLEEHRKNGLIYSGIYNSTSGINKLNQFIIATKITKDINPEYGSIQKLHTRDTDLTVCCEDKILKILANKDALYNADGNINLTATENVLGQSIPYLGDYGISKNPESFSHYGYRSYFTDKARGVVLRLSRDGLENISRYGMKDWFKDNLKSTTSIIGNYNEAKEEYNVTLNGTIDYTISFDEKTKGWTSFKSYIPESGVSINNIYYTFKNGLLYSHDNETRNTFYGANSTADSTVKLILNDAPSSIKGFKTLNYEGSQARQHLYDITNVGKLTYKDIVPYNYTKSQFDALSKSTTNGWYVSSISTNTQTGVVDEFYEKENEWFNVIKGDETVFDNNSTAGNNVDTSEFPVQGIGKMSADLTGDADIAAYNISVVITGLRAQNMILTGVSGGWVLDNSINLTYTPIELIGAKITKYNVNANTNLNTLDDIVFTFTCDDGYTNPVSQAYGSQSPSTFNGIGYGIGGQPSTTVNTVTAMFASHVLTADRNITITLNSGAISIDNSIAGTYNYNVHNTSVPNSDAILSRSIAYTNTGGKGTTEAVITKTMTAKTGYAFGRLKNGVFVAEQPTAIVVKQNDPTGKYTISNTNPVLNAGRLTSEDVVVSYTYGDQLAVTGDEILFIATGRVWHTPPAQKVKGYFWTSINHKSVHVPDNSDIPFAGGVRYLNIWGETGSTYGVTCGSSDVFMDGSLSDITANSKTLSSTTNLNRIRVDFPPASANRTHTFTLTGSYLDSSIVGGNPFTLYQRANITLTLAPHSIRYAAANEVTVYEDDSLSGTFNTSANATDVITRTFPAYGFPVAGKSFHTIPFKYVFDDSSAVDTTRTITAEDFSNTQYLSNNGTKISVEDLTQTTNGTALTITGNYFVSRYGNADITSYLTQGNIEGSGGGAGSIVYLTVTSGTNIVYSQLNTGNQLIVGHANYENGDVISGTGTIIINCPGYLSGDVTLSYDALDGVANNSSDTSPTFNGTGTSSTSATFNWSFTLTEAVDDDEDTFGFRVNASLNTP